MRFLALAIDYDGTLATHGRVSDEVVEALRRAQHSGRKLILVTGRELDDLWDVFPQLDLFDRVVAENGAVLLRQDERDADVLAEAPPETFAAALRGRGVEPVEVGHVVVATREPHETTVIETIREFGLELQVVFNKGAVMVLPAGVNKRSGLAAALDELGLSTHNVVGIGDAENDHAFLDACECAVAVANALPAIKARADLVTEGANGQGVIELVDKLLEDDLEHLEPRLKRHRILLGTRAEGPKQVMLRPYGTGLLVAGSAKAGKSSLLMGLIERIQEHGYQYCLIDPEGDYERLPDAINLGDPRQAPDPQSVVDVLAKPTQNVVVSLLSVAGADRPGYFGALLEALRRLIERTGRPHWLVIDEAHHVLPAEPGVGVEALPRAFGGLALVTLDPQRIAASAYDVLNVMCAVGAEPMRVLASAAALIGAPPPRARTDVLTRGQALVWRRGKKRAHLVNVERGQTKRRRHRRKYAEGELPPDLSFYFRGPHGALDLRAQNLQVFMQIADGVDDATWEHHLRAGDYSTWVESSLKDRKLARQLASVERDVAVPAARSRAAIRQLIEDRYAPPV